MAEVDDYVAASGLSAQEAFGDPTAYAHSLNLSRNPANEPIAILHMLVPVVVLVAAFWLTNSATYALFKHDSQALISWVLLPLLAVLLALAWSAQWRSLVGRWIHLVYQIEPTRD